MRLELEKERVVDPTQPINQGVTADRVVVDRRGIRLRKITYVNPCDGVEYVYLTNEMTLEPGLLVLLYKTRWEIEKVFDETKTKLAEQKSWATRDTAKNARAWRTRRSRRAGPSARNNSRQLRKTGQTLPLIYTALHRLTQTTFKLIRWLRVHWHRPTPLTQALLQLQALYAKL